MSDRQVGCGRIAVSCADHETGSYGGSMAREEATEQPGEVPGDGLAEQLQRLRAEIVETRERRVAAERAAATRRSVELAIETAMRDRDAGISPQSVELRRRGHTVSQRVQKIWTDADWLRYAVARLNAGGFDLETDPNIPGGKELIAQLHAEELHRERAQQLLDDAGVTSLRVPAAAPLHTRDQPDRDHVAALLAQVVQEQADREARIRKSTTKRAPDTGGTHGG